MISRENTAARRQTNGSQGLPTDRVNEETDGSAFFVEDMSNNAEQLSAFRQNMTQGDGNSSAAVGIIVDD